MIFYGLPDYETHWEFYEAAGISEARYARCWTIIIFDLDEGIDTEMMSTKPPLMRRPIRKTGAARRLQYLSVYTYLYTVCPRTGTGFDLLVVVSLFSAVSSGCG